MIELDKLDTPITEEQLQKLGPTLENLQGHILRSHGRDRSVHIFLRFDSKKRERTKEWIAKIAEKCITSAQKQLVEAKRYDDYKISGDVFCCFFLSAKGYRTLGIPEKNLPRDGAFLHGMKASQGPLADPPEQEWEEKYRGDLHAMLLLAADDEQALQMEVLLRILELQELAEICAVERGKVMRDPRTEESIEHFGYVDGRSQPLFLQKDVAKEQARGSIDKSKPEAGPQLVLVKDPHDGLKNPPIPAYGSYLVFRKLEQNVRGFQDQLDELAKALQLQGHDRQRAEALVMGRFRDGTPVVLQATPGQHDPVPNNFDFANDALGLKCPFQAHIRRMNPRGERDRIIQNTLAPEFQKFLEAKYEYERDHIQTALTAEFQRLSGAGQAERVIQDASAKARERLPRATSDVRYRVIRNAVTYDEQRHRIARRSVPYGTRQPEPYDHPSRDQLPEAGVGLLFMCYQRCIHQQFEFLQANWANKEDFPVQRTGQDAITGGVRAPQKATEQKWPQRWNDVQGGRISYGFSSFVTLKGGEYFFAPSISFLKGLHKPEPPR